MRTGLLCVALAAVGQLATHLLTGGPLAWLAGIAGLQALAMIAASFGPLGVLDRVGDQPPPSLAFTAVARAPTRLLAAAAGGALAGCLTMFVACADAGMAAAGALTLSFLSALVAFYLVSGPVLAPVARRLASHGALDHGYPSLRLKLFATLACVALCTFVVGQVTGDRNPAAAPSPAVGALLVLGGIAGLSALVVSDLLRGLRGLRRAADRLARGDQLGRPAPATTQELARLEASLRAVAQTLGRTVAAVGDLGREAAVRSADAVAAGTAAAAALADRDAAERALETAVSALGGRSQTAMATAERLGDSARQARADLTRGESGLAEVLGQSAELRRAAEATRAEAEELTRAAERTGAGFGELGERATAIATTTRAMDAGIGRARSAAADTAGLSARVSDAAEKGYRAVHHTLDAIERIRELSGDAHTTIDSLGARLQGIGQVVSVIEEIAQKTNLLALNASIIAAQAGQHGRGMAVVAGEIKLLAQRTAASTKEIAEQILGIQTESVRAMETMAQGVVAVDNGFKVAVAAGDALGEIRQIARAAQKKVQGIARVMDEHATAAQRAAEATAELATQTHDYASAAQQQARTGEALRAAAADLRDGAERVAGQLRAGAEVRTLGAVQVETALATAGALTDTLRLGVDEAADLAERVDRLRAQEAGVATQVAQASAAATDSTERLKQLLARLAAIKP